MKKIAIVGAGFSGAVIAHELAQKDYIVTVFESREQVGGNSYSYVDKDTGITVHKYGPHIFHTNSERIFNYLSQFTQWRPYEHRVRGVVNGKEYPFPINRDTLNQLYNLNLTEQQAAEYFEKVREML